MRTVVFAFLLVACHTTTTSTMPGPRPAPGQNDAPPGDGWACAEDGTCVRNGDATSAFCYLGTTDAVSCFTTIDACASAMQAEYSATASKAETQVTECAEWH